MLIPQLHDSSQRAHPTETIYRKTVLPSGIRVVTEYVPYVRSIAVGAWIDVGSRYEDAGNNGISHFLEHMVFKGTRRYSAGQIAKSIESSGGYLNAFTTKEHTCFYARILDTSLSKAIDVISDLIQNPVFAPKDLEKEKSVVIEELKNIEDNPDDLIHEYFDKSLYHEHPLGLPIIGRVESIRKFDRKALVGYVKAHYRPPKIVIAAAGNIRHEDLLEVVTRMFRSKSGPSARTRSVRARSVRTPRQVRPRKEIFHKSISQAHVCMGTIAYGVKNAHRFPLLVLNAILGEGMSSRLFQNIREKYGFAYSVYSFLNQMSDTGHFGVYIGTDPQKVDASIGLINKEIDKLRAGTLKRSEIDRAKQQLKGTMMLGLESMSNRMMRLGSGELYFQSFQSLDGVLKKLDAVTPDDLDDVARKLMHPDRFSTVVISPSSRGGGLRKVA